jgi:hypothetical protein
MSMIPDNPSAVPARPWFDGVHFELPPEGVPAAPEPASPGEAVAGGEAALAASDAAGAAVGVEPVDPAAPAPPPADPQVDVRELQAQLEYVSDQYNGLVQYLQSQGATRAEAEAGATAQTGLDPAALVDEYGNLDPAAFAAFLAQRDERLFGAIDQRLQRIDQRESAREEATVIAEGEQRLNDILADDIARNGEFAADPEADKQARSLVRTLAEQAFPEVAQRYGMTPRAAEIAMSRAADQVRGLLKAAGAAAVTQNANHLATLAGARSEPGVGGGSGVQTISDVVTDPSSIAASTAAKFGGLIRASNTP